MRHDGLGAIPSAGWGRWIGGLAVLYGLLVFPPYLEDLTPPAFLRLPLELPLILLALLAAPVRARPWVERGLALVLGLVALLKIADLIVDSIFAREFNAFLHLPLIAAGLNVTAGTFGTAATVVLVVLLFVAVGLTIMGIHRALHAVGAFRPAGRRWASALLPLALLIAHVGADRADIHLSDRPVAVMDSAMLIRDHAVGHWVSYGDRARFQAEVTSDPYRDIEPARLLSELAGVDVLLVFVESYGRSAVEERPFEPVVGAALARFDETLKAGGFAARSAWLTSPTFGGQSWLAHGTFASGLKIDRQGRYDALLMSGRPTLIGDFRRAGWRTVAVMPAMKSPWPDADYFGFDRVYRQPDLGYAGQPFGWITMPDQFALAAFQRRELAPRDRLPVMAQIALISSHIPWTPVPKLVPWEAVGDGAIFDDAQRFGPAPETLWRDMDRVREHYAATLAYDLDTLASFVAAFGDDDLMLIVLGDHQPIPSVVGNDPSHDVPIHIIARDPGVLGALDGWGWTPGMRPGAEAPVWPMERMRSRLLAAFTPAQIRHAMLTNACEAEPAPCQAPAADAP